MIFKIHYFLLMAGWCASTILLGVYLGAYTAASKVSVGAVLMLMPILGIVAKPLISSVADRRAAHREYLIACMSIMGLSHIPYIVIPILGPEVYQSQPQVCWIILLACKVTADVALNGAMCLGDALTMNYAKRLGVEFTVFRLWGTVSWMSFGVIIGQINEVSFLPNYTPGFMVLVGATLMDSLLLWLWPKEYFRMQPPDQIAAVKEKAPEEKRQSDHLKSLMTRNEILNHMRDKICGRSNAVAKNEMELKFGPGQGAKTVNYFGKGMKQKPAKEPTEKMSKTTQFKILMLLIRRDIRVCLYLIFFMVVGFTLSPSGFFFMGLADLAHEEGVNFSQLAGLLQLSMSIAELIIYILTKSIKKIFSRLSLCTIVTLAAGAEYSIYYNYWNSIDPYYFLATNSIRGIYFGLFTILLAEMAFMFAHETDHLLPEIRSMGLMEDANFQAQARQIQLSLAATMQALFGVASHGLGRGLGNFVSGLLVDQYSYHHLWLVISSVALISCVILIVANLLHRAMHLNLGLDAKAGEKAKEADRL